MHNMHVCFNFNCLVFLHTVEPITVNGGIKFDNGDDGLSASLTVTATGTNPVYKWFRNGDLLTDSDCFTDTSTATLQIQKRDRSGKYHCEISNEKSKRKASVYPSKSNLV